MFQQPNLKASKKSPMGVASSDFVDPETLPLQILHKEVHLDKNGKEQNGVDNGQDRLIFSSPLHSAP